MGSWDGPGVIASIDGRTYKSTLMTGAYDPTQIVAARNGKTYFCGNDDPLYIVDGQTDAFAGMLQDGYHPSTLCINPLDGRVYAACSPTALVVLDKAFYLAKLEQRPIMLSAPATCFGSLTSRAAP